MLSCRFVFVDSTGAVSYTHLDVYKRQPHRWYNKIYWIIAAMLSVVIGLRDFSVQDTENYAALYRCV